jgi:Zn-dependent peptidase ImmA (M78 family)
MASVVAAVAQESNLPTAAEINSVLKDLSEITGFKIRKQLPFQMITRDQVNHFLKDQIRQSVKPAEIRAEEATLKKFGFVPQDFDLKKTTIDLLTEQAAAFYDFHRKKLFISDWAAQNMREAALVHELGHALADQNFPIQKFLGKNADDSEESLARETRHPG